jgi:hypothetical protein
MSGAPGPTAPPVVTSTWIDEIVDAYVEWSLDCVTVREAYLRWSRGPRAGAGAAFAAYRRALDEEEEAAAFLESLLPRREGRT